MVSRKLDYSLKRFVVSLRELVRPKDFSLEHGGLNPYSGRSKRSKIAGGAADDSDIAIEPVLQHCTLSGRITSLTDSRQDGHSYNLTGNSLSWKMEDK